MSVIIEQVSCTCTYTNELWLNVCLDLCHGLGIKGTIAVGDDCCSPDVTSSLI